MSRMKKYMFEEMKKYFLIRTNEHINRVRKNARLLAMNFSDLNPDLISQSNSHDNSKFYEPEFTPYIYITWKYKMSDENKSFSVPALIRNDMNQATLHHITSNKHHPEYHDPYFNENNFNKDDRDSIPKLMVDGTYMDDVSIAEMVCDWVGMSQEKNGSNDASDWANMVINKRWRFSNTQVNNIWKYINFFESI